MVLGRYLEFGYSEPQGMGSLDPHLRAALTRRPLRVRTSVHPAISSLCSRRCFATSCDLGAIFEVIVDSFGRFTRAWDRHCRAVACLIPRLCAFAPQLKMHSQGSERHTLLGVPCVHKPRRRKMKSPLWPEHMNCGRIDLLGTIA